MLDLDQVLIKALHLSGRSKKFTVDIPLMRQEQLNSHDAHRFERVRYRSEVIQQPTTAPDLKNMFTCNFWMYVGKATEVLPPAELATVPFQRRDVLLDFWAQAHPPIHADSVDKPLPAMMRTS